MLSSLTIAFTQGLCLGGYIRGVSIVADRFVGSPFDWATPFSLLVAIALATGYALLGATWLIWRLRGESEMRMRGLARILTVAAAVAMATISIATLFIHPTVSARWGIDLQGVEWRYFLPLAPLPCAAAAALIATFFQSRRTGSVWSFLMALVAFACGYAGLVVSVWPYVVPYGFTAARSAADVRELSVTLIAAAFACAGLVGWSLIARPKPPEPA